MKRYLITSLFIALTSGCSTIGSLSFPAVHKIEVQQGNLITTQVFKESRTDQSRVIDESKNTGNEILHGMQVSQHISELES